MRPSDRTIRKQGVEILGRNAADFVHAAHTSMKQGNVSKQVGALYDAQLFRRAREGNPIGYAIRDDTIIQLRNLVCCKIENDALAQVAAFKGVSSTSAKKKSQSG